MGNETSRGNALDKTASKGSKTETNPKQPGANVQKAKPMEKPKDNDDTKEEPTGDKTALDVAFVLDCTGSMNSYIQSCKDNIISISTKIAQEVDNCEVQFALVSYRDIPPEDKSFITRVLDFTPIPFKIQLELEKIRASGGGDQPEALTSALYVCHKQLQWRHESIKIIIVITDAPPHGLEQNVTDGFPDGDIDTFNVEEDKEGAAKDSGSVKHLDLIEIIQNIRNELQASIYSVACEPDLSCNNDFANDFMQYIAEYTNGKFLPLSSAKLLPNVIVGSVKQQIRVDDLTNKLDEEIKKIKMEHGDDISADELNKIIMAKWKNEGVKKKEISIGTLYRKERSRENIELLLNEQRIKSLKDFKAQCKLLPRIKRSDFRHIDKNKTTKVKGKMRKKYSVSESDSESDEKVEKEMRKKFSVSESDSEWDEDDEDHKSDGLMTKIKIINIKDMEKERERAAADLDYNDYDDMSDSCESQQMYSRSASLSANDMYNMMEKLNVKTEDID